MAQPVNKPVSDSATRLVIYRDIADITWRMFVPSVGGAVAGVIADRSFGTKPWCTVAGVTVGFAIVVYLVYQQIQRTAPRTPNGPTSKKMIDKTD